MEIFALDLGNKQTKLKSSKAEYVLPSQVLNRNDMPQQLGNLGIQRDVHYFKVPFDDSEWAWGKDLASLRLDMYLQDTLMYKNRYRNDVFKLLSNFALGLLASDFEIASKEILEVVVVTGVPTDDYNSQQQLQDLSNVLKGQHQVEIDGKTVTVRVKKVWIIPQPVGTLYDLLLDNQGFLENESLLDERIGIVDVGGGTILIDTLLNFELDQRNRRQFATGANDLYEAIAQRMEGSVSLFKIEKLIRAGIEERNFSYRFSKNNIVDITDIVEQQIKVFSERLVRNLKSTFKDMSNIDTLIITGGAANLINKKVILNLFETATFLPDSEQANVCGYYKYALSKLSEGELDGE